MQPETKEALADTLMTPHDITGKQWAAEGHTGGQTGRTDAHQAPRQGERRWQNTRNDPHDGSGRSQGLGQERANATNARKGTVGPAPSQDEEKTATHSTSGRTGQVGPTD